MDVEKTMQFILNQQAASAAWQQQFEEDMKTMRVEMQASQVAFQARQTVFETNQTAIQKTQLQQLEMINRLIDLAVEQRASGKETDERLNALIRVVDGIIRKN